MTKFTTRDMVYISTFSLLIAVCSQISIPASVPFTMQTFAVFSALGFLGGKRGTVSVLIYILMGCIGLPVFSNFTGGPGIILGATGGYLLGFIFTGLIYMAAIRFFGESTPVYITSMVIGTALCYLFGTLWFMAVYAKTSGPIGLSAAAAICVFPFILPDAGKLILAAYFKKRLKQLIFRD